MKAATKDRESKNTIVVRIDPALDKYDNIVLFPKKLKKANEDLSKSNFSEVVKKVKR